MKEYGKFVKIINVVLKKSTKTFDIEYSYTAEDEIASHLKKGSLVKIPFGKNNAVRDAYVREILEPEQYKGRYAMETLKQIHSYGENAAEDLSPEFLALSAWMSKRYFCTRAAAIKPMTAPGGETVSSQKVRKAKSLLTKAELNQLVEQKQIKRIYQIDILEYLIETGETDVNELASRFSVSLNVLNTLKRNQYLDFFYAEKELTNQQAAMQVYYQPPKQLTPEQESAVREFDRVLQEETYQPYLLHGVTGSGKTEVYLNIIQSVIQRGKQAIVLVPEISLTPQMNARFKGRFGDQVAILHSRLTARERFDQWQLIQQEKVKLVVGARSAIFAPFTKLGAVIIDEEHETTYKSETTPKYHAAEIAEFRCRYHKALLVYGSATPSVQTSYQVQSKRIRYIGLRNRASGVQLPTVYLADMKEEWETGNRGIFSQLFCTELERNLSRGEQTMILINKRGFASALRCKECGYIPKCKDCNTAMTYHVSNDRVICHYCGYTQPAVRQCPNCGCLEMVQTGIGTQRAELDLQRLFPKASILRMDMDTTKGRSSHEEILTRFVQDKIDVLIGTQMIAKGHDFANVSLVGILAADAGLHLEDFRASERTFQLITQAAGRAGRSGIQGRVVIQTQDLDDYTIIAASKQDYRYFYTREMEIRKLLDFPPFTNLAVFGVSGEQDRHVFDVMLEIKQLLEEQLRRNSEWTVQILGPARYPLSKLHGKYRWRLILKCKEQEHLLAFCAEALAYIEEKKYKNITGPTVDINPVNMM